MDIIQIKMKGFCRYSDQIIYDSGEIVIPEGEYYYRDTKIDISETRYTMHSSDIIYITNEGLYQSRIDPNSGWIFDPSEYDWYVLFGYMDNGKFYYIIYEE